MTGGPTGQIRQAFKLLGLEEDALHWYDDDGDWNPAREGIKATGKWLVSKWTQQQAKQLAHRRPASFGHLSTGCDIQLTRRGLQKCPAANRGAMRSLMSGDTVTDDLSSKHFKIGGTGECNICGAPEGNLEHVLWKCVGPEGKWEQLRATIFKTHHMGGTGNLNIPN